MVKQTSVILASLILLVLIYGIYTTVRETVVIEPLSNKTEKGRLIQHTKNVTRIFGPADSIFNYLKERVSYNEIGYPSFPPTENNWKNFVKASINPRENPRHVIVLPAEDLSWALPGIYFAKYYGSPIIFANDSGILNDSSGFLNSNVTVYVLATDEQVPDNVLPGNKKIVRIAGKNYFDNAVKIAEYRDAETGFGWGRTHDRRTGYFNYVVTTPSEAVIGLAAMGFARSNNASLLYISDNGGIPAETERYIWSQRADWFVTPSEGPFRHFYIASNKMTYAAHGRMDFSVEKSEYPSMGPIALGPMEAIVIAFICWGFAGAIFVFFHNLLLIPGTMIPMRIAWSFTALLVPILGPALYLSAYRRPVYKVKGKMLHWLRPHSIQAASATAMGFGYGAPLMIAVGYIYVTYGFPLFFTETWDSTFFPFGYGMVQMMIGMYVFAVLIAWPLVQYPMKEMMTEKGKKKVLWMSFKVTAISMAAVSLGMMTISWVMMMYKLPMMPHEDEILWFGSMWIASLIGFLAAWPLNYPMVINKMKPGDM